MTSEPKKSEPVRTLAIMDKGNDNDPILLEQVIARYAKEPRDSELIREAIEMTGTTVLLRTLDRLGVVGRTATGKFTFDLAGRQFYFKNVTRDDLPRLPVGTQVHPTYDWIVLLLSGGKFRESKADRKPKPKNCPNCSMALPATGLCDSCD